MQQVTEMVEGTGVNWWCLMGTKEQYDWLTMGFRGDAATRLAAVQWRRVAPALRR